VDREGTKQAPWGPFLRTVSALALAGLLGLALTAYVSLRIPLVMRLDRAALDSVTSPPSVLGRLFAGLSLVSVETVALSLLFCVAVALMRGRADLAVGALLVIGGANVTTQLLKYELFPQFYLGDGVNGLPSGHMTVALSIALAAVIVAPPAWRSATAIGVSGTASLVGVALILCRYHRPSDVIAATSVCIAWAALGLLAAALVRRGPSVPGGSAPVRLGALIGASMVGGLLVSWGVRPEPGLRDLGLGVISLGSIGLACALSVAVVARVADRYLG